MLPYASLMGPSRKTFPSSLLFDFQPALLTLLEQSVGASRTCHIVLGFAVVELGVQPCSTASSTESIRIPQLAHLIVILPAQTGFSTSNLVPPAHRKPHSPATSNV